MDTRLLFQKISEKMRTDFELSAQVKHAGSKGTVRENVVRNFLAEGRLPSKYGVGSGEVVSRVRDTSRQCDLIIFDKLNGVTLLYDESIQVFPVDCVYGIVEVKSALSKTELLDSLDKIKALKEMAPGGAVSHPIGGGFTMVHARPRPFGVVFAFNVADNSLDSLVANLHEWEKENPPELWPNYICVLGIGNIFYNGNSLKRCLHSDDFNSESWSMSIPFGGDSLFRFYCALHDLCAHMSLGPVELQHYFDPLERIGKRIISGRVEMQLVKEGAPPRKVRISETAIERVVAHCEAIGAMRYEDVLKKQFGSVPIGMDSKEVLDQQVFLYNPNNLPGLHELGPGAIKVNQGAAGASISSVAVAHTLDIDGRRYVIAMDDFTDSDFDDVA